jgi:hypothetical protein
MKYFVAQEINLFNLKFVLGCEHAPSLSLCQQFLTPLFVTPLYRVSQKTQNYWKVLLEFECLSTLLNPQVHKSLT